MPFAMIGILELPNPFGTFFRLRRQLQNTPKKTEQPDPILMSILRNETTSLKLEIESLAEDMGIQLDCR